MVFLHLGGKSDASSTGEVEGGSGIRPEAKLEEKGRGKDRREKSFDFNNVSWWFFFFLLIFNLYNKKPPTIMAPGRQKIPD